MAPFPAARNSGHRRHAAARLAGIEQIPCRIAPLSRADDLDAFLVKLRECNRQRVKSRDEVLREEIISVDPEEAYRVLREFREEQSKVSADTIHLRGEKRRAEISHAKIPFLNAVIDVLNERRRFWPLSDRSIHYPLLNDPPLRHASKPGSAYTNTLVSYKDLCDLLTRARLAGQIPMDAIADPTRPVVTWKVYDNVQDFLRKELSGLLKGFYRDLMQSQPNHIEIIGEKNTIASIIRPVVAEFTIPMTLGRGYCSLPPRYEMAKRFEASGKEKLVLLILSDFDPDGQEIAHSLARSLRDDFGIDTIVPIKVALNADQVRTFRLPPQMKAKATSPNYGRFVDKHGDDVFELEALAPEDLQQILRDAIVSVIDTGAYNHEVEQEKQDSVFLEGVRRRLKSVLADEVDRGPDE